MGINSTVQKLRTGITIATLANDRSDALCALKGMSGEYCKEVGELCLDILLEVIKNYKSDTESVVHAVEAFIIAVSCKHDKERLMIS